MYYIAICIVGVLHLLIGPTIALARLRSSRELHKDLLRNVLRSPMSFFYSTPVGKIVTRFSRDVSKIDNEIIHQFKNCFINVLTVIFNVVVISLGTPKFIFISMPLIVVYLKLQVCLIYIFLTYFQLYNAAYICHHHIIVLLVCRKYVTNIA